MSVNTSKNIFSVNFVAQFRNCAAWAIGVSVLVGCSILMGCTEKKKQTAPIAEGIPELAQIINNSFMTYYDGPHKQWSLAAKKMWKTMGDSGRIVGYPVLLTVYDSLGHKVTTVLADTGTTTSRQDTFVVWGNVRVSTQEGLVVRSEKIWWSQKIHRVYSDTYVMVTTNKGDVMRGKGLDADEGFSHWSFLSEVSGRFPKFRERMENEENFFGEKP